MYVNWTHKWLLKFLFLASELFFSPILKAAELKEKRKLEHDQELEDNLTEIRNLLQGDLLSENPQQAVSSFGGGQLITDRWKGMTQEQLKEIRTIQMQQVLEKKVVSENKNFIKLAIFNIFFSELMD